MCTSCLRSGLAHATLSYSLLRSEESCVFVPGALAGHTGMPEMRGQRAPTCRGVEFFSLQ